MICVSISEIRSTLYEHTPLIQYSLCPSVTRCIGIQRVTMYRMYVYIYILGIESNSFIVQTLHSDSIFFHSLNAKCRMRRLDWSVGSVYHLHDAYVHTRTLYDARIRLTSHRPLPTRTKMLSFNDII